MWKVWKNIDILKPSLSSCKNKHVTISVCEVQESSYLVQVIGCNEPTPCTLKLKAIGKGSLNEWRNVETRLTIN